MTNDAFAKKCINIAQNVKTLYVMGGWGQPLTAANKKYFINNYSFNSQPDRKVAISKATTDTFAGDCNCIIKSILDGFTGDKTKAFGGATYGKPCADYTIDEMLTKECVDVSSNMDSILIGEYLVYKDKSHCGIYVGVINGKRTVFECTYRWEDGCQLIDMDCPERKDMWGYHGKLWNFMDYKFKDKSLYPDVNPNPNPTVSVKQELQACIVGMANYLQKMQDLVSKL